jgi:hypothetical protein
MVHTIGGMAIPDATSHPIEYRDALLALAGDRDPLTIIAATPDALAALCAEAGRAPEPAPGEWSPADVVGHLVDAEMTVGFRVRQTLAADEPALPGIDEKRWAALPKPPLDDLLAAFRTLRAHDLHLLRHLSADQLSRVGVHSEQGPETLEVMILKLAGHDLAHLEQLTRAVRG